MTSLEPEPPAAAELFGDRLPLARAYAAALGAHGEERGLIGPLEPARLWSRHILNCALAAPYVSGRAADVGSGAGLPGVVLAIARPDVQWVLIEPMERRTLWLNEQVDALGLENVHVFRGRGEEWPDGPVFDVVTARAVSALRTLLPFTAPLVRPGGELVFLKGAGVQGEIDAAAKQMKKYRVSDARVDVVGEGVVAEPTRVFRATIHP